MAARQYYYFGFLFFLFCACGKKEATIDCGLPATIEPVHFVEATNRHSWMPHQEGEQLLFVKQGSLDSVYYQLRNSFEEEQISWLCKIACPNDTSTQQFIIVDSDYAQFSLGLVPNVYPLDATYPIRLQFSLNANLLGWDSEGEAITADIISLNEPSAVEIEEGSIVGTERQHFSICYDSTRNAGEVTARCSHDFFETLTIAGHTYANVYSGLATYNQGDFRLYYSISAGLLAFEDLEGNQWLRQ